jgi:hypothetical protein
MAEQIQQLRRRLDEQVLERADADPQWKQQLIEDPETAMSGIPEARQLREMLESTRPIGESPEAPMPPTQEEYHQVHRNLMEKVLDRVASDLAWKQQLIDDPEAAIQTANFPETQRLNEMLKKEGAEVGGHGVLGGTLAPTPTVSYDPDLSGPPVCHWHSYYTNWGGLC